MRGNPEHVNTQTNARRHNTRWGTVVGGVGGFSHVHLILRYVAGYEASTYWARLPDKSAY